MYNIIQYNDKYKKETNDFIISIYVNEFGYKEARNELETSDYIEYINCNGNFWIALDNDNKIIGTIGIEYVNNDETYLKKLYVLKEYRGTGLAKELLNEVIQFSRKKGFKRIYLSTYGKLERANSFYLKNGFIEYKNRNANELNGDERFYYIDI